MFYISIESFTYRIRIFKHWAGKWQNLKVHGWQNKCLIMRLCYRSLSQLDFFEQTSGWLQLWKMWGSITSPIMFSNISQDRWCPIFILYFYCQDRVCCEVPLHLCVMNFSGRMKSFGEWMVRPISIRHTQKSFKWWSQKLLSPICLGRQCWMMIFSLCPYIVMSSVLFSFW